MRVFSLEMTAVVVALAVGSPGHGLERRYGPWTAEAAPLTYQGTELYTFMDGGAEIYLEYGFEQVQSQVYQRGSDEMTVELYRMRAEAYGLFTFLKPARSETILLGDAAFLAGYYLVFAKGPFLCAVTAQSAFAGSREAVLEVAGAISSRLEGLGRPPALLSLLPTQDREPGSEKQLRGPIGLRSAAPRAGDLFGGFSDGAVAAYGSGSVAGLLAWPDAAAAAQAWQRAVERAPGGCARTAAPFDESLSCADEGAQLEAARVGSFVVFASGAGHPRARGLIAILESSVAWGEAILRREQKHD